MASIRKRISKTEHKWQVQIRRHGRKAVSRSVLRKSDAEAWARRTEIALDSRDLGRIKEHLKAVTFGDLLQRYKREVTINEQTQKGERVLIEALLRRPVCQLTLWALTSQHLVQTHDFPERVILRDKGKRDIDYPETSETRAMRGHLRRYNEVLDAAEITIDPAHA